jgi:type IV pilus assembly protein PilB
MSNVEESKGVVLIVDDQEDIQLMHEAIISSAGYEVITAQDGAEALKICERSTPDLILLDVTMPGIDGYETCQRILGQAGSKYIPIVFVTGKDEAQDRARAFGVGASDYVVKPVDAEVLREKVSKFVGTGSTWEKLKKSSVSKDYRSFLYHFTRSRGLNDMTLVKMGKSGAAEVFKIAEEFGLSSSDVARSMADFLEMPFVEKIDLNGIELGVLPIAFCRQNKVMVIRLKTTERSIAVSNPFDLDVMNSLKAVVQDFAQMTVVVAEPAELELALAQPGDRERAIEASSFEALEKQLQGEYVSKDISWEAASKADSSPVVVLLDRIIDEAYEAGASDIHIEPQEEEILVRYRVDGHLRVVHELRPPMLIRIIVSRIKIMANLDISERRLPQDGRISFRPGSNSRSDLDLRVATSPMKWGEKVVMRILDKQKSVLPLEALGLSEGNLSKYRENFKSPHGMILHVGPTGSGKSMTLYAALNEIMAPNINIQTIEDPIEYSLKGINQLQTQSEIGLTFARALRSYLRQDPDIILVGEIRDRETAQISIEASMTGHLLLSTLHTNDAPTTVTRFIELGIEPFLVSSSIVMICAQRLVRRLCFDCRQEFEPTAPQRAEVGLPENGVEKLYRKQGCPNCKQIGFRGRTGIHELMVLNDRLRLEINRPGMTSDTLKRIGISECGMTSLYWDAMSKVREGICGLEDVAAQVAREEYDVTP